MSNEKDIKTVLDGAVETAKEIMTTEIFHAQLVKNTEAINKERENFENEKIKLQRDCDLQKDIAGRNMEALQKDRVDFEQEIDRKKASFNERERNIRDFRRKATEDYLTGMAKARSNHALKNLELQNERHKIFEAYRNSGGANLAEASQQMYPEGWSRPRPKDGGGRIITIVTNNLIKQIMENQNKNAADKVAANIAEERKHPIFEECEVMNAGKPAREHMLSLNGMYISGITDEQLKEMHEKLGKMLSGK